MNLFHLAIPVLDLGQATGKEIGIDDAQIGENSIALAQTFSLKISTLLSNLLFVSKAKLVNKQ